MNTLARCHCGLVALRVPRVPATVFECNCSICRRLGALWAYFDPAYVTVTRGADTASRYVWGERTVEFRFCGTCGCCTHWSPLTDEYDVMGVNARLIDALRPVDTTVRGMDNAATGCFWVAPPR
jgi:hypothetical protein